MAQALGEGVVALDEIGRLVSSAMLFPMGGDLVHIGMVITAPRLQDQGTGRWLMNEMLARSQGKVRMLNATKEAYRLYLSLGFQTVAQVWQQQGIARALPGARLGGMAAGVVRPGHAGDLAAMHVLDRRAFGSDRAAALAYALARSDCLVVEEAGAVQGFALCRPFGRGHLLGPVVARSEEEAVALILPHITARVGQFMRMDTRHGDGPLKAALETSGLVYYDNVTTMSFGTPPERDSLVQTFGLNSHALG